MEAPPGDHACRHRSVLVWTDQAPDRVEAFLAGVLRALLETDSWVEQETFLGPLAAW
jgi:hypothetical protein